VAGGKDLKPGGIFLGGDKEAAPHISVQLSYGNVPFFKRHSYELSFLHLLMMVVSLIGAPIVQ
jgi:hypothetical protein